MPGGANVRPRRVCTTPARIRAHRAARDSPGARPATAPGGGPLFQGTLYLGNLAFEGTGGPWAVAPADLQVVQNYLQRIAHIVAAYSGQYGPAALGIGTPLPPLTVEVANAQYSDQQLQGWVNSLARANHLASASAVLILNPIGVVNEDAKESGGVGVLGYHGLADLPYCFVNLLGAGLSLADRSDVFAEAVSHEVAEMIVDPRADGSNPEVCDGCGTNCQGEAAFRNYFDASGKYLGSANSFPPPYSFAFFASAIVRPASAAACPAPQAACAYSPP